MIRVSRIRLVRAILAFLLLQLASAAEDKFCPPGRCLCEKPAHEIHGDESPKTQRFGCCKPVWGNELNKDGRPVHGIEYTWKNTETTPFSPWGFGVDSSVKDELLQRSHHTHRCEHPCTPVNLGGGRGATRPPLAFGLGLPGALQDSPMPTWPL